MSWEQEGRMSPVSPPSSCSSKPGVTSWGKAQPTAQEASRVETGRQTGSATGTEI